ncbi:hypothetical protein HID58_018218 [Brassica napus]|uniref:Uncharacterized protein n=2 Tax=Brassica napus TaxID=3708 RepID=A0ABQ8D9A5_BRANA|nr:hypothetical protein HID58_018218 [Brassica napus]CDY49914.1 BnaA05g14790D [Brassica napus]
MNPLIYARKMEGMPTYKRAYPVYWVVLQAYSTHHVFFFGRWKPNRSFKVCDDKVDIQSLCCGGIVVSDANSYIKVTYGSSKEMSDCCVVGLWMKTCSVHRGTTPKWVVGGAV